jgi:hypothetical protein
LADGVLVHPEIVGYLVPYCIFQEFFKVDGASGQPFVRPLEDCDSIRHGEAVSHASTSQWSSLVESEQVRDWRFRFHNEGHVLEPAAKPGGYGAKGLLHQLVELLGVHLRTIVGKPRRGAEL